ncbi:MAG: PadR family transcriptional regulator [Kineosporiaceae bacterium]|nr:PadR family transcriptional regulator [Kineosporiaceae bacterium]
MAPRRPSPQTMAVLASLAEDPSSWTHGYDLCRALGLKAGTMYPILIRLAERGLVETAWEQGPVQGRPPRHLYRLSPSGARFLTEHPGQVPHPAPTPSPSAPPPRRSLGTAPA